MPRCNLGDARDQFAQDLLQITPADRPIPIRVILPEDCLIQQVNRENNKSTTFMAVASSTAHDVLPAIYLFLL